jgi:hypothetical protein
MPKKKITVTEYQWKSSTKVFRDLDPGKVGAELKALHDDGSKITPEVVIARARDPESSMHEYFEWDDEVAAQHHRKAQAKKLIQSLHYQEVILQGSTVISKSDLKRMFTAAKKTTTIMSAEEHVTKADLLRTAVTTTLAQLKGINTHLAEVRDQLPQPDNGILTGIIVCIDVAITSVEEVLSAKKSPKKSRKGKKSKKKKEPSSNTIAWDQIPGIPDPALAAEMSATEMPWDGD